MLLGRKRFYLRGPLSSFRMQLQYSLSSTSAVQCSVISERKNVAFHLGKTEIPSEVNTAIKNYLKKSPKKVIVNDGLKLGRYLQNRGRPSGPQNKSEKHNGKTVSLKAADVDTAGLLFGDGDGMHDDVADLWDTKADQRSRKAVRRRQLLNQYNVIRYQQRETKAFTASRTQGCYGSTLRVLNEIRMRQPDFNPRTVLDFGSGTGMSYWAAKEVWQKAAQEFQCVDPSDAMLKLSEDLIRDVNGVGSAPLYGVYFRKFLPMTKVTYDLVISAYTLSEIPFQSQRKQLIRQLWEKTDKFLVIIEHGNNEGFEINLQARDLLAKSLSEDQEKTASVDGNHPEPEVASVFAPCPHEDVCARSERETRDHPCNFQQRVGLSYCQEDTALKQYGYATERFSYIVLKKGSAKELDRPRLLHAVKKRKKHVICDLCCKNGNIERHVLTKSKHRELYKETRHHLNWGDMLPMDTNDNKPIQVTQPPKQDQQMTFSQGKE